MDQPRQNSCKLNYRSKFDENCNNKYTPNLDTIRSDLKHADQENNTLAFNKSEYNEIALAGKDYTIGQCKKMMMDSSPYIKLNKTNIKLMEQKELIFGILKDYEKREKIMDYQIRSLTNKYNKIRSENQKLDTMLKSTADLNKLLTTRKNIQNELKKAKETKKNILASKERRKYLEKINALLTDRVAKYELSLKKFNDYCNNDNSLLGSLQAYSRNEDVDMNALERYSREIDLTVGSDLNNS